MFSIQYCYIGPPRLFAAFDGPGKPVAPLKGKRAALFPKQATPDRIFPVRSVNGNFPNIMPPGLGTPRRFVCCNSANRSAQVWPVPRGPLIGFVQQSQQMLDFRVQNLPPQLRVHSSQTIRSTIAEAKMSYKCAGDRGIGKDHRIPLAELLSPKRRNPSLEVTKAMSPVSTDRGLAVPR